MSCFSFYFGHHMTTIEGGMISTDNEEIYQLARMFRSHGMTREASLDTHLKYAKPDVNPLFTFAVPGYNMRSSEINAVLGLTQLPRLDYAVEKRIHNLKVWLENLDKDLYFTDFDCEGNSNFALPLIWDRDVKNKITDILEREGVEYRLGTAGGGNQARQPYLEKFRYKINGNLDNSNYIHDNGLYIGNHTELTDKQIKNLCKKLNKI